MDISRGALARRACAPRLRRACGALRALRARFFLFFFHVLPTRKNCRNSSLYFVGLLDSNRTNTLRPYCKAILDQRIPFTPDRRRAFRLPAAARNRCAKPCCGAARQQRRGATRSTRRPGAGAAAAAAAAERGRRSHLVVVTRRRRRRCCAAGRGGGGAHHRARCTRAAFGCRRVACPYTRGVVGRRRRRAAPRSGA